MTRGDVLRKMNRAKRSGSCRSGGETLGGAARQRVCACPSWPKTAQEAGL